ncbi:anaerobic glycerol-3-phosphate dehydrogenase subunit C [Limisalsivibrio acetivorans]|uniref:anaerobic glycerol-3-phosphate dehydrogenase subunit C n=1 Tax=Limisalsivibrio acetivorans TaxID=1304888 RepID=UPI0003B75E34|nr:anaerobic glycerol-3-phosphate dehydrogenase subunit C [Limisalsivibrio acetivorans]
MPQLTRNIFEELSDNIKGDVYTDTVRRYLHSTDGSIFRVEPACVIYPLDREDVLAVTAFATRYGLSIHSRGAGSGLCGSSVGRGIVLDFTKYMNKLIEIDSEGKTFTCQPGYRFGELEAELKGKNLFFPPDPSSGEYASFGGMYGTNASGAHSVKYGNVSDYIEDAEIVFSDGLVTTIKEIEQTPYDKLPPRFRRLFDLYERNRETIENGYPDVKYNVSGYNLRSLVEDGQLKLGKLLGGSEGTLAIVTRMTFRLHEKPPYDSLVVAYFDDIVKSAKAVQAVLPSGPSGIEIMDKSLLNLARESDEKLKKAIPEGIDNVLMIEYDGFDENETREKAEEAMKTVEHLTTEANVAASADEKAKFWAVRKAAVPILYKLQGRKKIIALIEDAAVPTDNLVEYFEGIYSLLEKHGCDFVIYGHIAKGLLHTRPLLDMKDPHDIDLLKILADELFELVSSLGGVVSGEHGDGRIRSTYVKDQYKDLYGCFMETKSILDGDFLLNPDIKTIHDPYQMQKFLRFGSDYGSRDLTGKMLVWNEGFTDEAEKCHGCSKCTTVTTATRMCPVFKATRDETAAPKAKANVLRALISGAIDNESLYEQAFQSVMNKCVNCGSCVMECPSNVNIPKLAIEAKGQYVKRVGAPLDKKIVSSCDLMGKYTHKVSPLIAASMKLKLNRKAMELVTGVSAERPFVSFKGKSLYERLDGREFGEGGDLKVVYFAGCYAGYINPEIGTSAVDVLEKLGCRVSVPEQVCCGVPFISKGMLEETRARIKKNLDKWGDMVKEADHVVVTCSSCGLSLLKEWAYMLSDDIISEIKEKTIHISTLVNRRLDRLDMKECGLKLAYHKSCHLRVQKDDNASVEMLGNIPGVEVEDMNSSCCGMAGSWGMMAENYETSAKIGEPMLRKLNAAHCDYGVTDCPTCTIQMEHMSDKKIKHPVEVLAQCLKD